MRASTFLRRLAATAVVTVVAGLGLSAPASAEPVMTLSGAELAVAQQGLRHQFTKEETKFLYDAAKTGGETLVSLGCSVIVPAPANALCGPVAKFVVTLVASPFNPNGRCLALWADLQEFPPIGAKYNDC
ncbi:MULTISPECIES: hypothetical protein [unclassified Crossiella]|uniref:hypothetical protein n=1 Tax=unclassified Crossiella TaxID=2620835 RepID=UPI00200016E4|nr:MULTISPECIES: hypothetical protein [unclassified Crossiella]MCK2236479.1 hypothetical protein [Crossiella sp. S99.2]MCK2250146.1 hypothetical protein [Crossiella sp. S99.1]